MADLPESLARACSFLPSSGSEGGEMVALKERIFWLESILAGTGAGTWEWNVQTGETRFNERWAEIIGYSLQELQPTSIDTWTHFAHPGDLVESERALGRHFAGEAQFYACDVRMRHREGHWVWVRDLGRVVTRTADGEPEWMAGTHIEISEQKHLERELQRALDEAQELTKQLRRAQEIARLGYWKVNMQTGELYWSSMVYQIFGVDAATFRPSLAAFRAAVHPEDRAKVEASEREAKRTGVHDVVHRILRPDGEVRWVHELADHTPQGSAQLLIGTVRDITAEKEQELRLRQLSRTDELTGLYNRRYFMKRLGEELARQKRSGRPAAVVLMDFDHFKAVNDTHGHAAGDHVLMALGGLLQSRLRVNDLPARLGGEEFALLLPETSLEDAVTVAEDIRQRVAEQTFTSPRWCFRVSATCGVSALLATDAGVEEVLQRADHHLYLGKRRGRNRVVSDLDGETQTTVADPAQ